LLQNSYSFVAEETRQVPKTLLAVDDSATMRKVLEITFSGDDFRVVTASSAQAALAKMNEEPSIVLIDTLLGTDDGYALCGEIRRRDPAATILLLSSRHNPYDAAKGRDAGADDFMDKPFDTQQMVDKVKKTLAARESGASAPAAAPPQAAPQPSVQRPAPSPANPPQVAAQRPAAPAVPPERARARTLMFGDRQAPAGAPPGAFGGGAPDAPREATPQPPAAASAGQTKPSAAIYPPSRQPATPPAAESKPAVAPAAAKPAPKPAAAPPAQAAAANVSAGVNGHLAGKLGDLGLSQQQVDAVMALSREVVERVVWEVVPLLAETLIKEEIERLTKDG
jgi:CheY-like chemotaxis protein